MKKVLVICKKGQEYCYLPHTLHKVNQKRAEFIRDLLNERKFELFGDACAWYLMPEEDFDPNNIQRRFVIRGSHGKFHLSDEYID